MWLLHLLKNTFLMVLVALPLAWIGDFITVRMTGHSIFWTIFAAIVGSFILRGIFSQGFFEVVIGEKSYDEFSSDEE